MMSVRHYVPSLNHCGHFDRHSSIIHSYQVEFFTANHNGRTEFVQIIVIWRSGSVCPHCGSMDSISAMADQSARAAATFCGDGRTQFTAKVATDFESNYIPLFKWFRAVRLLASNAAISGNFLTTPAVSRGRISVRSSAG